ncbi:MAG: Ig-like domain-containing protein [Candidatus Margulisiibacteriota bacterium]
MRVIKWIRWYFFLLCNIKKPPKLIANTLARAPSLVTPKQFRLCFAIMGIILFSCPALMNTIPTKNTAEDTFLSLKLSDFTKHLSTSNALALSHIKITQKPSKGVLKLGNNNVTTTQLINTANITNLGFKPNLNLVGKTKFKWQGYQTLNGTNQILTPTMDFIITITPINDIHRFLESEFPKVVNEDKRFSFYPTIIEPDFNVYQMHISQSGTLFTTTLIDENLATLNQLSGNLKIQVPTLNQNAIYQIQYDGSSTLQLLKGSQALHTFTASKNTYELTLQQHTPTQNSPYKFKCENCSPTLSAIPVTQNILFDFGILNQPSWLNINKLTGEVFGTPNQSHIGVNDNIAFTAAANGQTVASSFFTINVINTNDRPITTMIPKPGSPNIVINEGGSITITLNATDEDKDNLRFLILDSALPKFGSTIINGNQLTYRHSGKESTQDVFKYYAKDKILTSLPSTISITISPINDKPILDPIFAIGKYNEPLIITLNARDDDLPSGQSLTYQILNTVPGAHIINNTLRYLLPTPNITSIPEKVTINVTATDPSNAKSDPTVVTIFLYQHTIDPNRELKIPDMVKSISQTTSTGSAHTILDVSNFIGNTDKVNQRYSIEYKLSTNNYFEINQNNGKIHLKNNNFPTHLPTLNVTVFAKITLPKKIVGVFSQLKFKIKKSFDPNITTNINDAENATEFLIHNQTNSTLNEKFFGATKSAELIGSGNTTLDHNNAIFEKLFSENGKIFNKNNLETKLASFGDDEGSSSEFYMIGKLFKSDHCTFGNNGTAIANVSEGTNEFDRWIFGGNENGNGQANVSKNAKITANELICGQKGLCNFTQLGGESTIETMTLGQDPGSSGTLNISNQATLNIKTMICGNKGRCAIKQSGGNLITTKLSTISSQNITIELTSGNATINEIELSNCNQFKLMGSKLLTQYVKCNQGTFENNGGSIQIGKSATKKQIKSMFDHNIINLAQPFATTLNTMKVEGDFTQKNSSPISTLLMNINSQNDYSKLEVTGTATLDGKLTVTKNDGLSFQLNQSFQLIKAPKIHGSFKTISLPTLSKDLAWDTSDLYSTGTIKVSHASQIQVDPVTLYIYPNPVINRTAIVSYSLTQSTDVTLQVFDIFGHKIYQNEYTRGENGGRINSNKVNLPETILNQLSIGVYFIIIHNNYQTLGKGKFAIR